LEARHSARTPELCRMELSRSVCYWPGAPWPPRTNAPLRPAIREPWRPKLALAAPERSHPAPVTGSAGELADSKGPLGSSWTTEAAWAVGPGVRQPPIPRGAASSGGESTEAVDGWRMGELRPRRGEGRFRAQGWCDWWDLDGWLALGRDKSSSSHGWTDSRDAMADKDDPMPGLSSRAEHNGARGEAGGLLI
jgi:hypothetical protein